MCTQKGAGRQALQTQQNDRNAEAITKKTDRLCSLPFIYINYKAK